MNSKNLSNVLTLTRFTSWHIVGFLEDKFSARGLAENVVITSAKPAYQNIFQNQMCCHDSLSNLFQCRYLDLKIILRFKGI